MTDFEKHGIEMLEPLDVQYYDRINNIPRTKPDLKLDLEMKIERRFGMLCYYCLSGQEQDVPYDCKHCAIERTYEELIFKLKENKGV